MPAPRDRQRSLSPPPPRRRDDDGDHRPRDRDRESSYREREGERGGERERDGYRERERYGDRDRGDRDRDRDRRNGKDDRRPPRDSDRRPPSSSPRRPPNPPSPPRRPSSPRAFPPNPLSPHSRSPKSPAVIEDKAKPNFNASGALAAATNTVNGVVLKYNEPPEARKPSKGWRLYVFKGKEQVDLLHISRQSAYLIGRDRVVADIPIDHPSCSKQHAVIQFRQLTTRNEYGDTSTSVKPFIIDLDSTNGTFVNDEDIPKSRYYELKESDVIKFGQSTREYVLLNEDTA